MTISTNHLNKCNVTPIANPLTVATLPYPPDLGGPRVPDSKYEDLENMQIKIQTNSSLVVRTKRGSFDIESTAFTDVSSPDNLIETAKSMFRGSSKHILDSTSVGKRTSDHCYFDTLNRTRSLKQMNTVQPGANFYNTIDRSTKLSAAKDHKYSDYYGGGGGAGLKVCSKHGSVKKGFSHHHINSLRNYDGGQCSHAGNASFSSHKCASYLHHREDKKKKIKKEDVKKTRKQVGLNSNLV